MDAARAEEHHGAAGELRAQRRALSVAVALSLVWIVIDAAATSSLPDRLDLALELGARIFMVGLVIVGLRTTRGAHLVYLTLWAVVLLSMDTYWQTAYHHAGGRAFEWTEMLTKYLAVGFGIACLLAVSSSFGDAPPSRLRRSLHALWLPVGVTLSAMGIAHGVAYINNCHFFVHGDGCITEDRATLVLSNLYLIADALARLAIVVVAIDGYRRASGRFKERTLLVASAAVILCAGTALDFVVRLLAIENSETVLALSTVDAFTTVLFPIALLWAATRRQLFDVEYVVRRSLGFVSIASLMFFIWGIVVVAAEAFLHHQIHTAADAAAGWLSEHGAKGLAAFLESNDKIIPSAAVVVPFLFGWRMLDERVAEPIKDFFFPVRAHRIKTLKHAVERIPFAKSLDELNEVLDSALDAVCAEFTNLLVHDGAGAFLPYRWTRHVKNPYPRELIDHRPPLSELRGHHVCLKCTHPELPDVEILALMLAAGKRCGVLVCGPPAREEVRHFAGDDVEHLLLFAAMAGTALVLHGAAPHAEPSASGAKAVHA